MGSKANGERLIKLTEENLDSNYIENKLNNLADDINYITQIKIPQLESSILNKIDELKSLMEKKSHENLNELIKRLDELFVKKA